MTTRHKKLFIFFIFLIASFSLGYYLGLNQTRNEKILPVLNNDYYPTLKSLLENANKEVSILVFQYFLTDYEDALDTIKYTLERLKNKGVKVRVILEGGEDFLGVEFRNRVKRTYSELKERGIEVRLDPRGVTTHAKMAIVDDQVLLGSSNWNYYAFFKNNEANVLIKSGRVLKVYKKYFDSLWNNSLKLEELGVIEEKRLSPIAEILLHGDNFDGREVEVSGVVRNLKRKVSQKGNPYTIFELSDGGGRIRVYLRGHHDFDEGDLISVKGVYFRAKRVGNFVFYNEIEAKEIKRKSRL